MPPTQANRLETLEETVAALQGEIPELKESMEEWFSELKKYFEQSQSQVAIEQNKRLDDCTKRQRDLKAVMTMLMAEVKNISTKMTVSTKETPQSNSNINYERSEVEQNRQKEVEELKY